MAISYPTSLDTFTTKTTGQTISEDHINDLQDAVEQLEARVGISGDELIQQGDKVLFYANTAPSNWTLDTGLDDKLVFVTKGSGAGGQTGGGAHSTGVWSISGLTVDAHTHSVNDHYHLVYDYKGSGVTADKWTLGVLGSVTLGTASGGNHIAGDAGTSTIVASDLSTNSSGGHTSGGASSSSISSSGAWRPAAYCFIVCSKDAYPLSS